MTSLDDYSTIKKWAESGHQLCIEYRVGSWCVWTDNTLRYVHPVLLQAIRKALSNIDKGLDYEGRKI